MKNILLSILLVIGSSVSASSALDDIVMDISMEYNQVSIDTNTEYFGVILSDEHGRITHTAGHSEPGQGIVSFTFRRLETQKIIAIWHTHGNYRRDKKYFSIHDTAAAKHFNVPIYMMDSNFTLRVYSPKGRTLSTSYAQRMGLIRGMAKGSIVNKTIAAR